MNLDQVLNPDGDILPRLRQDLLIEKGEKDTVVVQAPEKQVSFPIYNFEWRIAKLMDGKRSLSEIAMEMSKGGMMADVDKVRSFVKELLNYGFLSMSDTEQSSLSHKPSSKAAAPVSDEVRQLLDTALAMKRRGNLEAATNYLLAIIEIDPSNHQVRAILRDVQSSSSQNDDDDIEFTDPEKDLENPKKGNRLLFGALLSVLVGSFIFIAVVLVMLFSSTDESKKTADSPNLLKNPDKQTAPITPKKEPLKRIENTTRYKVSLEPAKIITVAATRPGSIYKVFAKKGMRVKRSTILATTLPTKLSKRIKKAEKQFQSFKKRLKKNKSLLDFVLDAKRRLKRLKRKAKPKKITAPLAGVVVTCHVSQGANISKKQPLFEIQDRSQMIARLNLPTGIEEQLVKSSCLLLDPSSVSNIPCTIKSGQKGGQHIIAVDNSEGKLQPGQEFEVEIKLAEKQ